MALSAKAIGWPSSVMSRVGREFKFFVPLSYVVLSSNMHIQLQLSQVQILPLLFCVKKITWPFFFSSIVLFFFKITFSVTFLFFEIFFWTCN